MTVKAHLGHLQIRSWEPYYQPKDHLSTSKLCQECSTAQIRELYIQTQQKEDLTQDKIKTKNMLLKEDTTSVHKLKANNKVLKGQKIANQTIEKEREQKALRFATRPGPNPIKHLHFRVGYN